MAVNIDQAVAIAQTIGYPVLVRPSHVLGGRAMEIVYDDESMRRYTALAVEVSAGKPILVDKFLEDAIEVDVDAVADGTRCVIGGLMEHIEEAGIHSGDSCCTLPAWSLPASVQAELKDSTRRLADRARGPRAHERAVRGQGRPRLPARGEPPRLAHDPVRLEGDRGAAREARRARDGGRDARRGLGFTQEVVPPYFSVKEPVFPFNRFPGVDIILGPEMRSTGEVMGIDADLGAAFAKAKIGAYQRLPARGRDLPVGEGHRQAAGDRHRAPARRSSATR